MGLVTGTCFADFGVKVTCVDKDISKIELLNSGEIPIFEPGLKELVAKNINEGRLFFTTDLKEAISQSLVVFIAVGTPAKDDGSADLSYIEEVARTIAENLNGYKVIVTKSTVPVGTGRLIESIVEEVQNSHSFDVASNPEFLREGSAIEDFMRPDRVVLGARSQQAIAILKDLYSPLYLLETPFVITDIETAELIKYASNAFLATKVSFHKRDGQYLRARWSGYKPWSARAWGSTNVSAPSSFIQGPGYGGSCFPKDTLAVTKIAREHDYIFEIVEATVEANTRRLELMLDRVRKKTGPLKGRTIGVLGLTFKPNTDDIRESPAMSIVKELSIEGAVLRVYDPAGMENAHIELPDDIFYASDSYEAAEGADLLLILTEWNQFRMLDLGRVKKLLKSPTVIDLRNIYEPVAMEELGFDYSSIGRKATSVD